MDPEFFKKLFGDSSHGMSDTGIIGACKECELVATLEVGTNFSLAQLDRTKGGGVIKAWCPSCKKTVEFVPHQHFLDKAHEAILKENVNKTL
jgi:hypothetical protein